MKKRFKSLTLILALMLILSSMLVGCSSDEPEEVVGGEVVEVTPEGTKHVFKLSNVFTQDQPLNITLEEVAENIYERTNGEVEIQVYPNGEIAAYKDGMEQVVSGAYFISNEDPSYVADYVPDYNALIGPMLYKDLDEYSAMCQTDFAKNLNKEAEKEGIKILALDYTFGQRHLVTNEKIENPEDLKGMKLRVPLSQLWIETLTAMGASPVPLAWSEVYSGVQQGVIDGLETSISDVAANQLQDITKNISLTGHFLGTTCIALSNEIWETLTPEQQEIMQEEFAEGAIRNNERVKKLEAEDRAMLEEAGVEFNEVDLEAFTERTGVVFEKFPEWTPGVYDMIQEELTAIRAGN